MLRIDDDDVVRVDPAEDDAGALLQEVAVDLIATQQGHPVLPLGAVGLHDRQFLIEAVGLDLKGALGLEATIAALGLMHEITDHEPRHGVQRQGHQHGTDATTDHHGHTIAPHG